MLAGRDVRLVTPEAVVLQFETAGLGSRILALILDGIIQTALILVLAIGASVAESSSAASIAGVIVITAVVLGYHPGFETLNRGRSPGKMALGLRVVTREGGPVRFRHAAIRGLLALVDFFLTNFAAAVISVLVTRHNQRLGDLVAGTLVVRERAGGAPAARPVSFRPPRGFEEFARHLDVGRMSPSDYEAVRAFVIRRSALAPDVCADVARSLAQPLANRLGHRPPPGMNPDVYLECLAAAYQARAGAAAPMHQPARPTAEPWPPVTSAPPTAPPARAENPADVSDGFVPPS